MTTRLHIIRQFVLALLLTSFSAPGLMNLTGANYQPAINSGTEVPLPGRGELQH